MQIRCFLSCIWPICFSHHIPRINPVINWICIDLQALPAAPPDLLSHQCPSPTLILCAKHSELLFHQQLKFVPASGLCIYSPFSLEISSPLTHMTMTVLCSPYYMFIFKICWPISLPRIQAPWGACVHHGISHVLDGSPYSQTWWTCVEFINSQVPTSTTAASEPPCAWENTPPREIEVLALGFIFVQSSLLNFAATWAS